MPSSVELGGRGEETELPLSFPLGAWADTHQEAPLLSLRRGRGTCSVGKLL